MLRSNGFLDVKETIIKMPINTWKNGQSKEIGKWFNVALRESIMPILLASLFHLKDRSLKYRGP